MSEDFKKILIPFIRKVAVESFAEAIAGVQPIEAKAGGIFSLRVVDGKSLPDDGRSLFDTDDITVLLAMGYRLLHGHNCCTGFGGKWRDPMPYWAPPGDDTVQEPCEHDWEGLWNPKYEGMTVAQKEIIDLLDKHGHVDNEYGKARL